MNNASLRRGSYPVILAIFIFWFKLSKRRLIQGELNRLCRYLRDPEGIVDAKKKWLEIRADCLLLGLMPSEDIQIAQFIHSFSDIDRLVELAEKRYYARQKARVRLEIIKRPLTLSEFLGAQLGS